MTGVALAGGGTTAGGTLLHDEGNRSSRTSRVNRGRLDEGRLLVLSTFRHLGMSGVSQTFKTKGSRPHPSWMRLHTLAANLKEVDSRKVPNGTSRQIPVKKRYTNSASSCKARVATSDSSLKRKTPRVSTGRINT